MFTGLVAGVGTVAARANGANASVQLTLDAPALAGEIKEGDSVAVSGTCLTARNIAGGSFACDVVAETLRRTTLGGLAVGDAVNLELALRASDRLGGHVVLGHVDGVATVLALADDGELEVEIEAPLARYVVQKGSIALDGVSLTVAAIDGARVSVALIPQTRVATTLGALAPGSRMNVEVDVLAKHVEKLVAA